MQTIYLDISNKGVVPTIYAKQNDVGRKFAVILTDSGLPYIPANGSAFSVWYKGASGEGNYTDIGDKSAFSLSGNKVEVEMIVQMISTHGDGILCLTLNSPDGNQISSWNIPYICEFVPGAESEKAEEYYTAFSKAVEKLPYPDETLSVSGKAADAAATGLALSKKAPAGYGLGGVSQNVDSADDATQSGFYQAPVFPETGGGGQMFGYVSKTDDDWLTQIWHYVGLTIKRDKQGGVWQPLEWFNPPMVPGEEYRTTERWNGQPVYVKAIYFGNLPNSTRRNVPHGIDGKSENIRHSIKTEQSGRMFDGGAGITEVIANSTDIYITTNTDLSECTIVFTLWYTKS
jgi:hypothetical protein